MLAIDIHEPVVGTFAVVALFSVLFTDALRIGATDLARAWRLPGRALLIGMPLTFAMLTALARILVGSPWTGSFLLAAILSPTDPVFAAAIVGRDDIPIACCSTGWDGGSSSWSDRHVCCLAHRSRLLLPFRDAVAPLRLVRSGEPDAGVGDHLRDGYRPRRSTDSPLLW